MKILKPGIILLIICAVAAALLGAVNAVTEAPIAEQNAKTTAEAMTVVLAGAEFDEAVELEEPINGGQFSDPNFDLSDANITSYAVGNIDGQAAGYAVSVTTNGYGGDVVMMVGIDLDGVITGVSVTSMSETAGLGANCQTEWIDQYAGKLAPLNVTKTGNAGESEIDAITSATITSKAVTRGVNCVYYAFTEGLFEGGAA
ncbi:MAG: RnfABCDGE type electron transport complex subunit G [Clostridiales bacterium]|nr:RnfABCDGE type electron transport complex subunit G [Clostridiales bacterium]